ncbi:MAG: hypothetical protein JW395_3795 [Nitrospira sp.]|nr:hypothetical protein [Nitrospira sp.]
MKQEIKVEDGIPVPERKQNGGRVRKYPLPDMKVGQSFAVDLKYRASVISVACRFAKEQTPPWKFCSREFIENGVKAVRVWRFE